MNLSTTKPANDPQEAVLANIAEAVGKGYALGDIYDYSEQDYEALYALGHGYYRQARYADALKAFAFLVMLQPMERKFLLAQASCLQMLDRFKEAINVYSMASFLDLNDPQPYFQTAECLLALGRKEPAAEALRRVIKHCNSEDQSATKAQASALLDLINIHTQPLKAPE